MIIQRGPIVHELKNAIVIPARLATPEDRAKYGLAPTTELIGGVVTEDGRYFSPSGLRRGNGTVPVVLGHDVDVKESDYVVTPTIYGGFYYNNHFGHFVTETMARLWLGGMPSVFIAAPWVKDISGFPAELLHAAGVKYPETPIIKKATKFKTLFVPEPSLGVADDNIYASASIRPFWIANHYFKKAGNKNRRVYLTRAGLTKGRVHGETVIEEAFREDGYEIISPEKLSIAEQVQLVNDASVVAGCVGSALHNMMFSIEPKTIIYIERTIGTEHTLKLFKNSDELFGHKGYYLSHVRNTLDTKGQVGPFCVDVASLFDDLFRQCFFRARPSVKFDQALIDDEYASDWKAQHSKSS